MPRVGGDVDDIAQQILTGRHHVADIDADTEFDALVVRHLGVSLSHTPLHLDDAAERKRNPCPSLFGCMRCTSGSVCRRFQMFSRMTYMRVAWSLVLVSTWLPSVVGLGFDLAPLGLGRDERPRARPCLLTISCVQPCPIFKAILF